jgi:putative PIN family toxin of toxin-antitoxin system
VRRIVLDANVLAPGFTSTGRASSRLLELWQARKDDLVVSAHLLEELAQALTDPYYARRLVSGEASGFVALLRNQATIAELKTPVVGVATHPEDDLVLSTALSGGASILCTRDKQLLKLHEYQTVSILSPGELLTLLEVEAPA